MGIGYLPVIRTLAYPLESLTHSLATCLLSRSLLLLVVTIALVIPHEDCRLLLPPLSFTLAHSLSFSPFPPLSHALALSLSLPSSPAFPLPQVVVDGNRINLEILDTAGQKEFQAFRDVTIGYADGFLVIFSLTDAASFEEAKTLAQETKETFNKPIVMAGNKKVR